ncbi:class I SAM-dependent methyltransferase [Polycladomyces subterraneus]|uniref:SAM-dependent methyltransferase n=1 Tax=Polycladomyces subterraneus TaxID=1016997 RepID=A0ABT8IR39_9BACL|nr:SAM-dependent methyltransferase [Polycladomyces subterraneus]MDN4595242.1 SAM-dependent methyltransferase [Polycladomyces subterraneus]
MSIDKEIRVVVGAGSFINNPGWIHTQEEELNLLKREDWIRRFQPGSVTAILAEHVWEHLTYEEGVRAAHICFEFLKPGGYVRCAVPDGFFPDLEYQRIVQVGGPGPKDHPAASHKIVYNYRTLTQMFEEAGFETSLLEYCDENGQFHYRHWDPDDGKIFRSLRFDHRNKDGKLRSVSIIVDAIKPQQK